MLIRLEHNGRIIHEIGSAALSDEIVIGRSHSCTWPVPKEDALASSRHASLTLKGKAVWLKDLDSTNGTFYNGKKIAKRKLAVGDKIGVGNCLLCVEQDRGGDSKTYSEIQIRSGKGRGQRKQLIPPVFTIGSDPTSNLVFLDMLVSRRHAEILVKEDGSCWIRDLGSKNGTSVNGMPLRDDKERLLKDGDRIAFSHLEIDFHDGAVKRSNKQAWLRIGILAATLVACLVLYAAYQRVRPSAEAYLRDARQLASKEKFSLASAAVERAANARRAADNQVSIEEMRRLLGVWENTRSVWLRAQDGLNKGTWTEVSRNLGMLQASKKDAWEWNAQAAVEKENMTRVKVLLDAFLRAEASINREDLGFDELTEDHANIVNALARIGDKTPPYLAALKAEMEKVSVRQISLLAASRGFEHALDQLRLSEPPYPEITRVTAETCASNERALCRRAQTLQPPVNALAESFALHNTAVQYVLELAFAKALAVDIKLPASDTCSLDPRVSTARQNLEKAHASLKVKAGQLLVLFSEIEKRVGRDGDLPACFVPFGDADALKLLLACDSLQSPLPKRSRKEPIGTYDRLVGIEEFYTYLSAFPDPIDPAIVADLPFVSLLSQVREASQRIEAFLAFVRQPDNTWLMSGPLQAQTQRLQSILARRNELLATLVTRAEADTGRAGLLAGGVVARLATQPGQAQIKGLKPEEWVAAELKRQRAALLRLNDEYGLSAPARQIEIRSEILAKGLPGDPIVRRMWAFRDAGAGSAPR